MPLLILIADDDPGIRLAVKDYLEISGYSVLAAQNGQEALSLLETYHPHLLVSDIKMPRKDGYDLVKQVRQLPQFRLLPVIFLTEKNTIEERIVGYQTGCDVYLPKPFAMEELGAVIRNLLERSQIMQSEWRFSEQETKTKNLNTTTNRSLESTIEAPPYSILLTKREEEVLKFLTKGHSNAEIGNKLHLSARTIEKYVSSLFRKTETNNRAELIRFALDRHLVD